ncbi:hypothetical protein GLYMA_02G186950v4 [Glycine max]|nr:hypothetical protein GLYMA_02G186950v4 [Glycine max]KAH1061009.1 hypothetical protein GYH30_004480 [Glycine max]
MTRFSFLCCWFRLPAWETRVVCFQCELGDVA